jgi:WD40 repeat protein
VTPPEPGPTKSSTIRLLEPDGRARWTRGLKELGGWPVTAVFTADGTQVAVEVVEDYEGGHPVTHHDLIDARTGTPRPIAPPSPFGSANVTYDPWVSGIAEGATTMIVGSPARVGVFDRAHGTTTWLDPQGREIRSSSFIPVTGGVLEGADDGAMWWYPSGAQTATQKLVDHTSQVLAAATDAAGSVLVTGGYDHRVVVHRRDSAGKWVTRDVLTGHQGSILDIAVTPDGRRAFSTSEDRTVIEWDLTGKTRFGTVIPEIKDPTEPDAQPLVLGVPAVVGEQPVWVVPVGSKPPTRATGRMFAAFMDPGSGKVLDWVPVGTRDVIPIPFAAAVASWDGHRVAVTAQFSTTVLDVRDHHALGTVQLDDVDGRPLGVAGPVPEPVSSVAWSTDGSRLFLGAGTGESGAVVVVNTSTWRPERRILASGVVNSVATSPDGRLLAVGYDSGQVLLADAITYRLVRSLTAHVGAVRSLAFSPDGSRLAAVGGNKRLDVWEVADGRSMFERPPYLGGAGLSVQWQRDGSTVVFGGDDGLAVRFDVVHGVVRGVPFPVFRDGGGGYVFVAPAHGDQLGLLPGTRSRGVPREGMIYSLDPVDWLAHACDVVQRDLTTAEWAAYVPQRPYRGTCTQLEQTPQQHQMVGQASSS